MVGGRRPGMRGAQPCVEPLVSDRREHYDRFVGAVRGSGRPGAVGAVLPGGGSVGLEARYGLWHHRHGCLFAEKVRNQDDQWNTTCTAAYGDRLVQTLHGWKLIERKKGKH